MTNGGVAAVGECMLELSGGNAGTWRMGHAGDVFNALWAIRALSGAETACDLVTAFGDDPFSVSQRTFFTEHGIGAAASPTIAGARPGLYAITLDGAERSFTYWRSDSAARRLANDTGALARSLENRALVYFSGITLAILDEAARKRLLEVVDAARRGGARIAFDPNHRPRLWASPETARGAFEAALGLADIALPTFGDEAALFGDATPQATIARLSAAGVGEIAVKDGQEAALVAAEGKMTSVPPVAVRAVDTTGAGDAFNGGYLAARLAGLAPRAAAGKAHRVAAAAVGVHGALAPFDTLRRAFTG